MWRMLLWGLAAVAVVVLAVSASSESPIRQPIAYNHHVHVEGEGLICTDCHTQVEDHPVATIPEIAVCADCHDVDPLTDSPEEERLIGFIESGQDIPWQQVYSVPSHVYFSHRRHVVLGELECSTCHGAVAGFTEPVVEPVQELSMDWCMECHESSGVTNDCLACHR